MSTHSNHPQTVEQTASLAPATHTSTGEEVPAGIRVRICYAVVCTGCGTDTDGYDEYTPHFPTHADALAYWTNSGEELQDWTVGPTGIRCPACTCTAAGHAWDEPFAGAVQCQRCQHMKPRHDSSAEYPTAEGTRR